MTAYFGWKTFQGVKWYARSRTTSSKATPKPTGQGQVARTIVEGTQAKPVGTGTGTGGGRGGGGGGTGYIPPRPPAPEASRGQVEVPHPAQRPRRVVDTATAITAHVDNGANARHPVDPVQQVPTDQPARVADLVGRDPDPDVDAAQLRTVHEALARIRADQRAHGVTLARLEETLRRVEDRQEEHGNTVSPHLYTLSAWCFGALESGDVC